MCFSIHVRITDVFVQRLSFDESFRDIPRRQPPLAEETSVFPCLGAVHHPILTTVLSTYPTAPTNEPTAIIPLAGPVHLSLSMLLAALLFHYRSLFMPVCPSLAVLTPPPWS